MKFGQYELLERVAVGGMAEVYRGRVAGAEGFEKWVAIKRILPEFARDDRFISMMLTEARIHSGLSHGNIVQIHDLGISEDGEYFIVLEYVEGHDLRAVMEAATELGVQIPDSLALHVADELAQALHFAHELTDADGQPLGIIHRDVSPSNVLISNSGEVKLSDFGIAKRRHDHSFVGSLKGNLVYMSPEQAQRVSLDRRTDVFSLGAVLFEMLTGHKLRDITDEVNGYREVASGVVRSARALRADLPEAYEALLARALAANPADRFPDAAAFGAAIRALGRENDAPVGPADMKELIELLDPPRRARSPVERSKVIRLGPEFKVLAGAARGGRQGGVGETSAGSPAGSPFPAPGMVPVETVSKANGNRLPVWADTATAHLSDATPPPLSTMAPTPPPPLVPVAQLPPATDPSPAMPASRYETSFGAPSFPASAPPPDMQATPPPPPRGEITTPVSTAPLPEASLRPTVRFPATARFPAAPRPQAEPPTPGRPLTAAYPPTPVHPVSAAYPPITAQQQPAPARSLETPPPPVAFESDLALSMPTPPPVPGAFSGRAAGSQGGQVAQFPQFPSAGGFPGTTSGFQAPASPQQGPLAPAAVVLRAGAPISRPFMPSVGPSTAVITRVKTGGGWRSFFLLLLAALAAGAAIVHFKVVPLEVAVLWLKPASLSIASDPPGADVTLDGRKLPDKTPLRTEVRRDRAEHVLELSRPGSRSVRTTMRFDRTVPLSQSISLPEEPPPPPPPVEAAPPPPPPAAAAPEPPIAAKKPLTKAQVKAAKAAARAEKKAGAKLSGKAAKKAAAKQKAKKKKSAKKKAGAAGARSEL